MIIGRVIHKWRVASDIEQKQLAREIGISESTLCRIEQGKGCDARTLAAMIAWLLRDEKERDHANRGDAPDARVRTQKRIDRLLAELNEIAQDWDIYTDTLPLDSMTLTRMRQAVLDWMTTSWQPDE